MDLQQIIDEISKVYCPISQECKEDIIKFCKVHYIEKNKQIVKEGQFADKSYFLVKGCARAFYLKEGKDITDWFAFENDFITSLNSYFLNIPSAHYIETLEDSILLEIPKEHTEALSSKHREFDKMEKMVITKTMLLLQQRVLSLRFETAQQKYDNLLSLRPDITQRVPLTHIASFIGITLETLSRIRNPKNRI